MQVFNRATEKARDYFEGHLIFLWLFWKEDIVTNRFLINKAFYKSIPVMAGYLVLGTGFGILLRNAGLEKKCCNQYIMWYSIIYATNQIFCIIK